jgi:hypothetical protein
VPPGHWLRKPKEEIASQKRHFLSFLCIDYTTFNAKITKFAPLTSAPGALVNISLKKIIGLFS